jgi:hypothetical protein
VSIALAYLEALKAFLDLELIQEAPVTGTFGVIQVGMFKDDPEKHPATLTLHVGDPDDPGYKARERIDDQVSTVRAVIRHQVIGGVRELGGGDMYWYRFTARVRNYMTRSGMSQMVAARANDHLIDWLTARIEQAQPHYLGVVVSGNERLGEIIVDNSVTSELGGPPTSWIWHTSIHFSGLVHRDR